MRFHELEPRPQLLRPTEITDVAFQRRTPDELRSLHVPFVRLPVLRAPLLKLLVALVELATLRPQLRIVEARYEELAEQRQHVEVAIPGGALQLLEHGGQEVQRRSRVFGSVQREAVGDQIAERL